MPYREKDEDDDLEKVYKEVGVCVVSAMFDILSDAFGSDRSQYLDFNDYY